MWPCEQNGVETCRARFRHADLWRAAATLKAHLCPARVGRCGVVGVVAAAGVTPSVRRALHSLAPAQVVADLSVLADGGLKQDQVDAAVIEADIILPMAVWLRRAITVALCLQCAQHLQHGHGKHMRTTHTHSIYVMHAAGG